MQKYYKIVVKLRTKGIKHGAYMARCKGKNIIELFLVSGTSHIFCIYQMVRRNNIYQIYSKLYIRSLTKMNYFPNPYFATLYQQPFLENPFFSVSEPLPINQDLKQIRILQSQNKLLRQKVESLQLKLESYEQIQKQAQILRNNKKNSQKQKLTHECIYPSCERNYKSTLALNLHIKMKHNGGSIREREAYAKLILQCQRDNKPRPEININFPPNFIENYRKKMVEAQSMMKQTYA